jgi:hypothetical protein
MVTWMLMIPKRGTSAVPDDAHGTSTGAGTSAVAGGAWSGVDESYGAGDSTCVKAATVVAADLSRGGSSSVSGGHDRPTVK